MTYKFIDLFAGIGGFHYAFHSLGFECVFASEIDPHARTTYEHNLKRISPELFNSGRFNDDILKLNPHNIDQTIPDFDVLCAGFPCQPFSQAGLKKGMEDARGSMFYQIAQIIRIKRPSVIFLENVRYLIKHDEGRTFDTMRHILEEEVGYDVSWHLVKASDFGLPQYRPRVFIIGFRQEDSFFMPFVPPAKIPLKTTMSDLFGGVCNRKIGYTLRVGGRGSGIDDKRNWDAYLVGARIVSLTPQIALKMQGFPDGFEFPVSERQAMKQLGNSVAINAVQAYGQAIITRLEWRTHGAV